ncbi:FixH family protein [Ectorhizobium quercum]
MIMVIGTFFGVIITVNMFMAWQAARTWSGLVVPNTYVASQEFNSKVAAQRQMAASGIAGKLSVEGGIVTYAISHPETGPVDVEKVVINFLRPVGTDQDFTVELNRTAAGIYTAVHDVRPGQWIAEVKASDGDTLVVHEANRFFVVGE